MAAQASGAWEVGNTPVAVPAAEWEERVTYLDAEVRVIDGQPVLVYETEEGYEKIPFSLPGYAYADGQKMPLQTQGNDILVPTEEGLVAVPIEEFCVVMVDGQIMLLAEENPWWTVPVAVAIAALTKAGVAITTATIKAASLLIVTGQKVTAWTVNRVVIAWPIVKQALRDAGVHICWFLGGVTVGAAVIDWLRGVCIMPWCGASSIGGRWTHNPARMVCGCFPHCP